MTCWVKLPTPALPGSGSRRPETAVCFDLSRGCPSAPLFLCPNLLYTSTADCQAFQILSTRFPRFYTLSSMFFHLYRVYYSCTQKTPRQERSIGRKSVFSAGLRNPKAFPRGGRWPVGRMRGGLADSTRSWNIVIKLPLISPLRGQLPPQGKPFLSRTDPRRRRA